jgi:hypothetical protein
MTLVLLIISCDCYCYCQPVKQVVRGKVTDSETHIPLAGAGIILETREGTIQATTGEDGRFRVSIGVGRIAVRISYLGYAEVLYRDVLVETGKEVELNAELTETVIKTRDIIVTAGRKSSSSVNTMATVSSLTLRSADALRFAGGYYDPSRMINSFAGISTSNNDYSNEIVIRGNSPRGMLWRLEGIEIPNPNHFSTGQGASGGAYSAVSSNSLERFGFYTGAFPAEFGNAISGVMDLDLRQGNNEHGEYAFQTGMIGAEASAEGPLFRKQGASYIINARYINFSILRDLGLIGEEESNIAPHTSDIVFNFNIPGNKAGNFNIFGLYGTSQDGIEAEHNYTLWDSPSDNWEEIENEKVIVAGLKHTITLPDKKTYIKTTLAFTSQEEAFSEGYLDSTYTRTDSYHYKFIYPSARAAVMLNHKVNASVSLRGGFSYDYTKGDMQSYSMNSKNTYDTLVNDVAGTSMTQFYGQCKLRVSGGLEINAGLHMTHPEISGEYSLEPRLGLRRELAEGQFFVAGMGLHTHAEALPVHYTRIKSSEGSYSLGNRGLKMTRSLQWVAGFDLNPRKDLTVRLEAYYQYLYNVPIIDRPNSKYSILNNSHGLPDAELENAGAGANKGIEITIEKSFTRDYYFLLTASLFESKYRSGDKLWHDTYYNNRYVTNLIGGKDFHVGRDDRSVIGINAKILARGGYRYTPVDFERSLIQRRVVYIAQLPYYESLPGFFRADAGISFRKNNPKSSWIVMLDVQNVTDRRNIFRKNYVYSDGKVSAYYIYSLGMVPVFNFRVEF